MTIATKMVLSLPTNFSARGTTTTVSPVKKQFQRSNSASTALTEMSSLCLSSGQSVGTIDDETIGDDFEDVLEYLEAYNSDDQGAASSEDDILMTLLSYEQSEAITRESEDTLADFKSADEARIDTLALRVAELDDRFRRGGREMRRLRRQARIIKAQEEYIQCLEALGKVASDEEYALALVKVVNDEECLKKEGLMWQEVELNWDI